MKDEIAYSITSLRSAHAALSEGIRLAMDELDHDGVIQRFEFTFELLWKTYKLYLDFQGIQADSPRASLKEAFRLGLIGEEALYLDMLEDRNLASHVYKREIAEAIYGRIVSFYKAAIGRALETLEDRFKGE
ncbi:MAG: hypothetical protein A2268_13035 [Candidatus Raymondbacteria bacterium RifOxyA12_full_50_37]|uniref:Nucleotidyltransferase n=1 Tax=Candidatus Raymondbacteria bacterium RIFOXYD12_FULL_49_13 TaxID=1817890 RepID=A0A1F7EZW5_UNCRA|nr:MAG: hypothetical protein A2268_13035 [Candidatus Raymondbacteria bacterium RifOxyA12_full_50_37]OGJ92988.1 MAG: hypothetical protein A2248_18170 [Candidatus Raymondbacteria bacterium RIFOXYA2_FULL_49_16]OGJ95228.1 MAG: hypothetical protein A2350_13570 [Candidatus Raymondbacteria bacterium RifOxyB12_full_50_8]OGJ97668.1 MAG: hypothetical protein A2487_13160 [Candidatus Raymondbacteria bacterium RifOxyC12_full_50_8]OGJ99901.1 MAG: hypothetical protein A2519_00150 [Candidatus Raymondbacteria b